MVEQWRSVVGFDGYYEVSDQGCLRSCDRTIPITGGGDSYGAIRALRGRPLPLRPRPDGYVPCSLSKDGLRGNYFVHRLVAVAFVGPCPDGMEVAHQNGVRSDNRRENLAYASRSENNRQKVEHGTHQRGERNGASKLTNEQAAAVKFLMDELPVRWLAEAFGITAQAVYRTRSGLIWASVPPDDNDLCRTLRAAYDAEERT